MQEKVLLDKKTIADYLRKGVSEEPQMMIELLVEKVYVHSDQIELILHYVNEPNTPKPRIDEKDELPEGQNLQGILIFITTTTIDEFALKSIFKKEMEPKFKKIRNIPVYIKI